MEPFFFVQCNKTITRSGFCDIQNNQGLGTCEGYQLKPKAYLDLDHSGYHRNLIQ